MSIYQQITILVQRILLVEEADFVGRVEEIGVLQMCTARFGFIGTENLSFAFGRGRAQVQASIT